MCDIKLCKTKKFPHSRQQKAFNLPTEQHVESTAIPEGRKPWPMQHTRSAQGAAGEFGRQAPTAARWGRDNDDINPTTSALWFARRRNAETGSFTPLPSLTTPLPWQSLTTSNNGLYSMESAAGGGTDINIDTNSVIDRSHRLSDLVYLTKFDQLHRLYRLEWNDDLFMGYLKPLSVDQTTHSRRSND
jgi:hypothetical protein